MTSPPPQLPRKEAMPKIKVLTAHNVTGMGGVPAGTILDVDEYEARRKVQMGFAEYYAEPEAPVAAPEQVAAADEEQDDEEQDEPEKSTKPHHKKK